MNYSWHYKYLLMFSSLLPLKLKIITGYVILVLLFVVLLMLTYRENERLSVLDKCSRKHNSTTKAGRGLSLLQILDIALLSEQAIVWDKDDITTYGKKRNKVVSSLKGLQNQLPEGSQRRRISSILSLLSAKETRALAIVEDLKELRASNKLISERIPNIIQQTKQDKQKLAEQIKDNASKARKKSGFLGLFHSKKKSRLQAEDE